MRPDDIRDDNETSAASASDESDLPVVDPYEDETSAGLEEDEAVEEGPRSVLITGASGNIGSKLRAAWKEKYDLVLIDRAAEPDDSEVIVADLAEFDDEWIGEFHGVDTVVHLAANPDEFSTWEELERPNLDALCNVFHAAALAGVERLVFASSNHAMGGYRELGERFEARERSLFGQDGFAEAVRQVESIEREVGIHGLDSFTPR